MPIRIPLATLVGWHVRVVVEYAVAVLAACFLSFASRDIGLTSNPFVCMVLGFIVLYLAAWMTDDQENDSFFAVALAVFGYSIALSGAFVFDTGREPNNSMVLLFTIFFTIVYGVARYKARFA